MASDNAADFWRSTLDHEEHVRVAWHSLRYATLPAVLAELPGQLQRYAAAKGIPEAYHETVTFAFVCLVHERVARQRDADWWTFIDANPDLLDRALLHRYYDKQVLDSAEARQRFLWPAAAHP